MGGAPPDGKAAPTTTTLWLTIGGELDPIPPLTGRPNPLQRSTMPSLPKSWQGRPVFASNATKWYPGVTKKIRASLPSVQ